MKPLEEALKLEPEAILDQIKVRRELIGTMVGWLYPSILEGEIEKLYKEYDRRKYAVK